MLLNNKGFSLLENLIAASILAIAVTSLFQIFSMNLRSLIFSEDYIKACIKADEIMKDIHLTKDLTETSHASRESDGTIIKWETRKIDLDRTKDIPLELYEINVKVIWTKDKKERSVTLTTYKSMTKRV